MKPISSSVSTQIQQTKPYLPPKPIKYRTQPLSAAAAAAAAASCIDVGEHLHSTGLNSSLRDQFDDQEPLSVPRSKTNQGPLTHHIRLKNDKLPNQQPSPQPHPDQGHWFPPSGPSKNLGVSRNSAARPPDPRGGVRSLRHSQSRTERMKLERERFLANLIQSEEDSSRPVHASNSVTRHPSLPPSSSISASYSICPNSRFPLKRSNANDKSSPTSQSKTSSSATHPAIVTSSTMEIVTSSPSHGKPSVTSSSSKKSTVTSSEFTAGGDVIYDEPSVEFERKSLDRLVLSDGYLKLRSDVVEEEEKSVRGNETPAPAPAPTIVRLNSRTDKPPPSAASKSSSTSGGLRPSRSSESVDRLEALLDFSDYGGGSSSGRGPGLRSSFVDPNGPPSRRSVYIELGEYQTLLKHSRNDDDECLYSLPQPLCYSEDTLKAVKLITEKYDTFKRRQLRDLSFRDGTVTNRKSTDGGVEPVSLRSAALPVESSSSIRESNNNKSDNNKSDNNKSNLGGCGVQEMTAADVAADAPTEPDVDAKPRVEGSVVGGRGARACGGGRENAFAKQSKQSSSLLLRDYCNTLETGVDVSAADSGGGGLSKLNLMRIELFYRSQEASIFVCRCLADLFVGGTSVGDDSCPLLVHQHTGVPVWLLNSGEGGVRGRELLLFVAERETGFPLWQDKINYLSNYDAVSPAVHSLRVSGSLRKTVRLHMFCERSAAEFMDRFREMTSDPHDDLWKISSKDATTTTTTTVDPSGKKSGQTTKKANKKRTTSSKKRRGSRLSKASISHPCNFVHISRVDPTDPNFRAAFSGLIPLRPCSRTPTADPPGKALDLANTSEDPSKAFDSVDPAALNDNFESAVDSNSSVCEFRPRLPTR